MIAYRIESNGKYYYDNTIDWLPEVIVKFVDNQPVEYLIPLYKDCYLVKVELTQEQYSLIFGD